jgi:site-specific recombinase XerD
MDPLTARRPHIELFLRWMQEVCRYKPSTVSRRLSIVAGFYRTCVIDGLLEHSPAEYVRRPRTSTESPTLGLSTYTSRRCSLRAHNRPTSTTSPW